LLSTCEEQEYAAMRRLRSFAPLGAVAAIVAWSALSVVNAFGTTNGGLSASSSQYEYNTPSVDTAIKDAQDQTVTSAPVGSSVHDTVTVSGTSGTPIGDVTFQLYGTTDCTGAHDDETKALVNGSASSTPVQVPSTGLSYIVTYDGSSDPTYGDATSGCESLSAVSPPPPSTWSISGSGTIAGVGQVSFDLSMKVNPTGATGSCTVIEPKTKTKIKCLGVTSATLSNGNVATLSGPATINGAATTYQIVAKDAGAPGVGADSFAITAGSFSRSGTLTSGNITVHT
jgi:hypothetical protein